MESENNLLSELSAELQPRRLLLGLASGLVVGSMVVILAISFAALVFAGDLSIFMGTGVGLALGGAVVLAVVVALSSSFRAMVATPQDSTAAVLALIAASTAAGMAQSASEEEILVTVVAAIALTTTMTGIFFFLLGRFRLGGLVRYLPYPVIGGFLAGTGWLLVRGSVGVMSDLTPSLSHIERLVAPEIAIRWVPGLILAVALLWVLRRFEHFLVLPLMLLGSIAFFYLLLLVTGTPIEEARQMGLLLGPFPESDLWRPMTVAILGEAHWRVVLAHLGSAAPVLVVGVVALLLNATGLELSVRRDIDLDRELRAAGIANVFSGLIGGLPGFQTLALSALAQRMSPDSRLTGLFAGALCAAVLAFGGSTLSYLPIASLGGLLLFLGLAFLMEWVVDARSTMSRVDYLVVLVLLVVIATVGFLESVGAGIVIAVVIFVINYSRVDVVRHTLTGETRRSNVDRPEEQLEVIANRGDSLLILKLQGYLFFGTANSLLDRIRSRLDDSSPSALAWVVIDFRLVSGLDSSAVLSFVKIEQLATARGFGVVVTDLADRVRVQLEIGCVLAEGGSVRSFPEVDRGIAWCEDQFLIEAHLPLVVQPRPVKEALTRVFRETVDVDELLEFFERQVIDTGENLMSHGDSPEDGLYFIESGQVSVQLEVEVGSVVRLSTMGPGSIIGELELYLGIPRTASVVAESPCVVWCISSDSLTLLQKVDPSLAARFHQFVGALLADRLIKNHQAMRALLA